MYIILQVSTNMQESKQNKRINISQARQKISQLFNNVYKNQEERTIVEKSGIVMGAIISPFDLARLKKLDQRRDEFITIMNDMGKSFQDESEESILKNSLKAINKIRKAS